MAKLKIETENGTCVVETAVDKSPLHRDLPWEFTGEVKGGGIAFYLASYHVSRSKARESCNDFISSLKDLLA